MNSTRAHRRITVPLAAIALATGAVSCGDDDRGARPSDDDASLVCRGAVDLEFEPSVNWRPKTIDATGTGTLDGCGSKDGSHPNLKSARVTVTGSGTETSCTGIGAVSGTVDITWYDGDGQTGRPVGTTRVVIDDVGKVLTGHTTADSPVLPGRGVTAEGSPTSDVSSCPWGLDSGSAAGEIVFR
ncbi:hypothetical protein SUDANB95_02563 [Actinosynnema sp. ALI-1.44]